ncbi:hypothetical protein RB195_019526 [Necator americanus]|uniref:Uncharacterized protein n=1 Tax=Necator americanus TaxID=51031 RepID=A0ABR1CEL8_NECAM
MCNQSSSTSEHFFSPEQTHNFHGEGFEPAKLLSMIFLSGQEKGKEKERTTSPPTSYVPSFLFFRAIISRSFALTSHRATPSGRYVPLHTGTDHASTNDPSAYGSSAAADSPGGAESVLSSVAAFSDLYATHATTALALTALYHRR